MNEYFDTRETCAPEERETELFASFPAFLSDVMQRIPGWQKRLAEIDVDTINSREALAKIPVMRKPELMEAQAAKPPFGDFVDQSLLAGTRVFMSPGPVWEPQAPGADPWLAARALHAAGIRSGDVVLCSIGYTLTPGGAILDEGLRALGATVFPAGVGNTEVQAEAIETLRAKAYVGTPDFLQAILDKAKETGKDVSSLDTALVSGGALFPSMRKAYEDQGIRVSQSYATADIGSIAHETWHGDQLCEGMICNEDLIVEIVRPGTDDPVADGEVGEIVVTSFNKAYPLVRFGTGDMSAVMSEPSPCGRTNLRIKGWMGRADQRTKIKGMFVDPKQISQIVKSVGGVEQARLVVSREDQKDVMTLQVIGENINDDDLKAQFANITKLRGETQLVDSLPNDGKVIDDQRDYSS
ncbi:MAG: AMP-binding protein [Rhizobiaceae bacterium]|nr:AMP-binding protein [Rhizobiaceae bacterium]